MVKVWEALGLVLLLGVLGKLFIGRMIGVNSSNRNNNNRKSNNMIFMCLGVVSIIMSILVFRGWEMNTVFMNNYYL